MNEHLAIRMAEIMARESKDWTSSKTGAILHKITLPVATTLAGILLRETRVMNVPLAYAMGSICQESRFDPLAENPNLNRYPRGFATTDWGMAQISGRNLIAMFSGDEERAKAYAFNPEMAIPYACRNYRALLTWAKESFPQSDPFYVGSMAYNKGKTGATLILTRKTKPGLRGYETWFQLLKQILAGRKHAGSVMKLTRMFRDELSLQSP